MIIGIAYRTIAESLTGFAGIRNRSDRQDLKAKNEGTPEHETNNHTNNDGHSFTEISHWAQRAIEPRLTATDRSDGEGSGAVASDSNSLLCGLVRRSRIVPKSKFPHYARALV
jgi:hypothetical protein